MSKKINPITDIKNVVEQLDTEDLQAVLQYAKVKLASQTIEYPLDFNEWEQTPELIKGFIERLTDRYETASNAYLSLLRDWKKLKNDN